ncbi:MAG: hypothetical protein ABIN54_09065 [candidate division WOR-3 bacterium]
MTENSNIEAIKRRVLASVEKFKPLWEQGKVLAEFYRGLQGLDISEFSRDRAGVHGDEDTTQLYLVVNRMRYMTNQVVAKLLEYAPRISINPITSDEEDILQAEAAERLVNVLLEANHFPDALYRFYYWLLFYGQAYFYVHAVKENGERKILLETPEPNKVLYDTQGRDPTLSSARWSAIFSNQHKDDLKVLFPQHARKIEKAVSNGSYWSKDDDDVDWNEYVKIVEYWEKATPAHPNGLHYIFLVSPLSETEREKAKDNQSKTDWIILNSEYDGYAHGELPLVRVVLDFGEGFAGSTPLADEGELQEVFNGIMGKFVENVDYLGNPSLVFVEGSIRTPDFTNRPGQMIPVDPMYANSPPHFLSAPPVNSDYLALLQLIINAMDITMGLTPLDRGEELKADSATAWQITEANRQKLFRPRLYTLALGMKRAIRQLLSLAAEFWAGEESLREAVGRDLYPYAKAYLIRMRKERFVPDVSVDTGQNSIFSRAFRPQAIMGLAQILPLQDPEVNRAVVDTILRDLNVEIPGWNTMREAQRRLAQQENVLMLKGKLVEVQISDDHIIHISIHKQSASQFGPEGRDSESYRNLMAHIEAHNTMWDAEAKKTALRQLAIQAEVSMATAMLQKQIQEAMGLKTPQQVAGEQGGRPPNPVKEVAE